ncbi:MAG TPA: hypothetical protein VGQ09_19810 [Chitinophagaceae bacterium]|jgi:hypothetical protein|nr:hypothetical protein [Chitinophagaceae bacterium]
MKKNIRFLLPLFLMMAMISCKKEDFNGLSDVRPTVPVTVTNAIDFRPEPTVTTSISAGGSIQIVLAIPTNSGRTMKEITKVAASTTYTQIQSTGTTGFYTSAPIPVNNTTYTFNTSLAEYIVKGPGSIPSVSTTAGTELAKRFYFLIMLDDGSVIIPESVRVLVTN